MSKTYQIGTVFAQSGDLRTYMALDPESGYNLEDFTKFDNLITITGGAGEVFAEYSAKAEANRLTFIRRTRGKPCLMRGTGVPFAINNLYDRKTCVIVGSGKSLDVEAVLALQEEGAVIIVVGRAASLLKSADFWVGRSSPDTYPQTQFYANKTLCIVPMSFAESSILFSDKLIPTLSKYSDLPNLLQVVPPGTSKQAATGTLEGWLGKPHITDFGTGSSLGLAISFAACAGFSNILLSGVDMGGSLAAFYGKAGTVDRVAFEDKVRKYHAFKEFFPALNKVLLEHSIRISAVGSSPFYIPSYSLDYLREALESTPSSAVFKHKFRHSSASSDRVPTSGTKHMMAQVNALNLYAYIPGLIDRLPHLFDTEEVISAYEHVKEKIASGGCGDCAKRRRLTPIFNIFRDAVASDRTDIQDVWEGLIPNLYTIQLDGKLFFRKDKRHLEEDTNG